VQVLLDDHVASAGEGGILVADDDGVDAGLSGRILGPVDKADHVALVEEFEAVRFVDDRDRTA
jgi:hypothetical protein